MSRPVRTPTGCLPHATAHDKRPSACRPPEFLFPRRFNCGTWRGNNFSTGRVSYGKHATYLFDGKTCSNCSNVNAKLKREPRWQCPSCGMNHDRNINAAVNLHELLTLPPGSGVKLRDGKALTVGTPHGETSPDQRACHRHTTVHQTGQKTGHSAYEQAVSYSEIPLKCSVLLEFVSFVLEGALRAALLSCRALCGPFGVQSWSATCSGGLFGLRG